MLLDWLFRLLNIAQTPRHETLRRTIEKQAHGKDIDVALKDPGILAKFEDVFGRMDDIRDGIANIHDTLRHKNEIEAEIAAKNAEAATFEANKRKEIARRLRLLREGTSNESARAREQ